jgi:hypothetical protein
MGEKKMMKKSRYERVVIVISRDELTQMIGAEEGFEIEKMEDKQDEIFWLFVTFRRGQPIVSKWANSLGDLPDT